MKHCPQNDKFYIVRVPNFDAHDNFSSRKEPMPKTVIIIIQLHTQNQALHWQLKVGKVGNTNSFAKLHHKF